MREKIWGQRQLIGSKKNLRVAVTEMREMEFVCERHGNLMLAFCFFKSPSQFVWIVGIGEKKRKSEKVIKSYLFFIDL